MRLSLVEVETQRDALERLARLALNDSIKPALTIAAKQIVQNCPSRSQTEASDREQIDLCELEAIYDAVKNGTNAVPGLENGVRYVSDSRWWDHFVAPSRLLQMCRDGACAEDCDGHAALIAALASAIGFKAGLRAWGPKGGRDYTHVYAVTYFPKQGPFKGYIALDTTVYQASVGWEPPQAGRVCTVWLP